jgi:putative Mg2+ transporter-C (MgtC) family protein
MTTEIFLNSIYFQIFLALILGSFLGIERNFAGKTAGMRTYGLMSMGSCLFIIISAVASQSFGIADPTRIAAGIITGIGFLCGGAIIFRGTHPSGLTTAAGLWVSCGIGVAIGYKLYALSIFVTLITLMVFTLFWSIEQRLIGASPENHGG